MNSASTLELIENLQARYVKALDREDLKAWLDLFDSNGQYFVITADNETAESPMALMMDDCHARLEDRVKYVEKVWTFDSYRMRHLVQRLNVEPDGERTYKVESNVAIFYTDEEGKSSLLAVGRYEDLIHVEDGRALFLRKRFIVDSFLLPLNIVYPM